LAPPPNPPPPPPRSNTCASGHCTHTATTRTSMLQAAAVAARGSQQPAAVAAGGSQQPAAVAAGGSQQPAAVAAGGSQQPAASSRRVCVAGWYVWLHVNPAARPLRLLAAAVLSPQPPFFATSAAAGCSHPQSGFPAAICLSDTAALEGPLPTALARAEWNNHTAQAPSPDSLQHHITGSSPLPPQAAAATSSSSKGWVV
jgi:hypothetical protein